MKLLHKGRSSIETYKLVTKEKYVNEIFTSSGSCTRGKFVSVTLQELEDSEWITHTILVDAYPDMVEVVPLKHEYHVVLVYNVWGLPLVCQEN